MNMQKGFSAVEGLIIVLVVAVIGFAGYTVWNNNQDEEAEVADTTQNETQNNEETAADEETVAEVIVPADWVVFTDSETRRFSMSIPNGWKIFDNSTTPGFFSSGYLDDVTAPAEIIETDAGKGGPFLFNAGFSEIDSTQYYGSEDTNWENKYKLDATRYVKEITEAGTDGSVGDTSYRYVFDTSGGQFIFSYLMSPGAIDSRDDIELALHSLELN